MYVHIQLFLINTCTFFSHNFCLRCIGFVIKIDKLEILNFNNNYYVRSYGK